MIQFTHIADDNPDLALSPLLRGAQLTLDYIETNGPIGLTPLKALKRYFVQWAAEAFAWPFYRRLYILQTRWLTATQPDERAVIRVSDRPSAFASRPSSSSHPSAPRPRPLQVRGRGP